MFPMNKTSYKYFTIQVSKEFEIIYHYAKDIDGYNQYTGWNKKLLQRRLYVAYRW